MACSSQTTTNSCGCNPRKSGNGYLLIIVLYILLAIIVGSFIC